MSHACIPILVGVASPVSEIKLGLNFAKFPFLQTMDYIVHGLKGINILLKESEKEQNLQNQGPKITINTLVLDDLLPLEAYKQGIKLTISNTLTGCLNLDLTECFIADKLS